jgi:hypothetical protein
VPVTVHPRQPRLGCGSIPSVALFPHSFFLHVSHRSPLSMVKPASTTTKPPLYFFMKNTRTAINPVRAEAPFPRSSELPPLTRQLFRHTVARLVVEQGNFLLADRERLVARPPIVPLRVAMVTVSYFTRQPSPSKRSQNGERSAAHWPTPSVAGLGNACSHRQTCHTPCTCNQHSVTRTQTHHALVVVLVARHGGHDL